MLISNGLVLHYDRLEPGSDVRLEGEHIAAIGPGLAPLPGEALFDAAGHYVLPGLIHLHTHGLRQVYLQEGGWLDYARCQLEYGVTACLPTLYSSPDNIAGAMEIALAETGHFRQTPNLLGFRLEMPYLTKPGAGQASALVAIQEDVSEAIYAAGQGKIKIWDVSPEREGRTVC